MKWLFKRILIANRGEIAARIIRTCKSLGIETVAVYSEADAESPYVKMATQSHCIGGSKVSESYLNYERIIKVAKETNAEAIHPGYGLLSENALFAKACEEQDITFIGPTSDIISRMGSKIEARKAMEEAGVPIVPGNMAPLADADSALEAAKQIGYPVMLKASAGGGGIGMQLVKNDTELLKAFEGNSKRAADFFGDGTMFIEKFISQPRHIEIQIAADYVGNTIYLGERECSIQRRHQKVVEEALSPFIDPETREKMGAAAVRAAKAIGYSNLGTVEFLVDDQKNFYFLEMNTRLQVEHPITEEVTGLDLVKLQLEIAANQELPLTQEEVQLTGHAIEVRIYAEDPKTFFPSPGTITKMALPTGNGIRHELGAAEGSVISPFYDPMIGKLIAYGTHRQEAIQKLSKALDEYIIEGIKTNIPLLKEIIHHPEYQLGNTTTDFIQKYIQAGKVKA